MPRYAPGQTPAVLERVVEATERLREEVNTMEFSTPVSHVYNPLAYAREPYAQYLRAWAATRKRVVFLGMNPGPWGMAQTGIPFGEVRTVREWMGMGGRVGRPSPEHPKRPILGFSCERSEVSGFRFWSLFRERFGAPECFFADHFVANYCPLLFLETSGRNRTPDKLPAEERAPLLEACDRHLADLCRALEPLWLVGIGRFAAERARFVAEPLGVRTGFLLHPSPASPLANSGWAEAAAARLSELGVWVRG